MIKMIPVQKFETKIRKTNRKRQTNTERNSTQTRQHRRKEIGRVRHVLRIQTHKYSNVAISIHVDTHNQYDFKFFLFEIGKDISENNFFLITVITN